MLISQKTATYSLQNAREKKLIEKYLPKTYDEFKEKRNSGDQNEEIN